MDIPSLIINIVVGIGTGCLSSYIITRAWQGKMDEHEYYRNYDEDFAQYSRYLDRVRLEMGIGDEASIQRAIEERPITSTFAAGLNAEGSKAIAEIEDLLKSYAGEKNVDSRIYAKQIQFLKSKNRYRNDWKAYKKCLGHTE